MFVMRTLVCIANILPLLPTRVKNKSEGMTADRSGEVVKVKSIDNRLVKR